MAIYAYKYPELTNRPLTSGHSSFLQGMGALGLIIMGFTLLLALICLFSNFFTAQTRMLTEIPGINGGDLVTYAFWAAAVIGFLSAQAFPAKWHKKLVSILGFWVLSFAFLMPIALTWETFAEYRLFKSGKTQKVFAEFRVIDVEAGRKRSRRAKLASPDFRLTPTVSVDQQAYDTLKMRRFMAKDDAIMQSVPWQHSYTTNQCISLIVEQQGKYKRLRLDGRYTWPDFKPCSEKFVAAEKKLAAERKEARRTRIIVPNCEDVKIDNRKALAWQREQAANAGSDKTEFDPPIDRKPPLCTFGKEFDIATGQPFVKGPSTQWVQEKDLKTANMASLVSTPTP
jgi:hypothetical protein